jgi:hypothetical protein
MERRATMLAASVALTLALAGSGSVPAASVDEKTDAVEIVGLLLKERLAANGEEPDGTYLVVAAEYLVICPPKVGEDDEEFSFAKMVEDGCAAANVPAPLRRELLCQQEGGMLPTAKFENAEVVLQSQITAFFAGDIMDGWDTFYRTFPGSRGYVEFTAPVFSSDHQQALVYVSHSCGGLCGTGWLVNLTRQADGHWRIAAQPMLWIS